MVASAFPLAEVALRAAREDAASTHAPSPFSDGSGSSSSDAANIDQLPFGPARPDAPGAGPTSGTSSRPWAPGDRTLRSSGSALLDEVLGAARMMGIDAELPDLPLDQLAPVDPLRPAILAWVAATHAPVPPVELERELARADALPQPLQRDLALVVLSAAKATLMQRQALSALSDEQLAWIYTHPDAAARMARGVDDAETRILRSYVPLVDTKTSIEASLLMLEAVEATRGSLQDARAHSTLDLLDHADLDARTQALLTVLAQGGAPMSDADKVRYAARLVSVTTGVEAPPPVGDVGFADAVSALVAETSQTPDEAALAEALRVAALLPADLQLALAKPLFAQAQAVRAANPAHWTPDGQAKAMLGILNAVADALPTLEKYHLYWADAPDALRVAQWDPSARVGWAADHAALLVSTHGDLVQLAQAAGVVHGVDPQSVDVPQRSFADAYAALARESGRVVDAATLDEVRAAGERLDPRVQDGAALLMSGAAESARLHALAFADVSFEERAFLVEHPDIAALYAKPDITDDELSILSRYAAIAAKVDALRVAQSAVVAARATLEARDLMLPAYSASAESARPFGFWDFIGSLLPFGSARAQETPCVPFSDPSSSSVVSNDCDADIVLRLTIEPLHNILIDFNCAVAVPVGNNIRVCAPDSSPTEPDANSEVLLITGLGSSTLGPQMRMMCERDERFECPIDPQTNLPRPFSLLPAFGAARVQIDLGGSDTYARPVAMTYPFQVARASLMVELGGTDHYLDPTGAFGDHAKLWQYAPRANGHATQGSALGGGAAVLLDVDGDDSYEAPSFSQGYGQWGLGMLADLEGIDNYRGARFVQGASGRDMALGAGILFDAAGDDETNAQSGQGFGLGGFLLDTGGRDVRRNQHDALGAPIVHLNILPGGNLTVLDQRVDNRVWLDGPAELDVGVGIDTDVPTSQANQDGDFYNDFLEYLAGTDPADPESNPSQTPTARVDALAVDNDGDTYPDFVERALSTDANDASSYPAGFPRGPTFFVPGYGPVNLGQVTGGFVDHQPEQNDKVIDLRLPLQDAGSIDYACVGPSWTSSVGTGMQTLPMNTTTPVDLVNRDHNNRAVGEGPCSLVTFEQTGPGEGTANLGHTRGPVSTAGAGNEGGSVNSDNSRFDNFTFRVPAGILAVGDSIATSYDIDYFLVIDIGGDDRFENRAGGSLPVLTRPTDRKPTGDSSDQRNHSFFAPSLVLNVDLGAARRQSVAGNDVAVQNEEFNDTEGNDLYVIPVNATGEFSQGSMLGVLIDTAGADRYTASSASQGALGGILLDLEGADTYRAGHLSQGASLASPPPADARGVPSESQYDHVMGPGDPNTPGDTPAFKDSAVRYLPPGMLLDMGEAADLYAAGSNSQGFARGYDQGDSPVASSGILLDQGGADTYTTLAREGANVQGVGFRQGVGILADLGKAGDVYQAWGPVSQGSVMSMTYDEPGAESRREPGAGILLDLGGFDAYTYYDRVGPHSRTLERQGKLTLYRGGLSSPSPSGGAGNNDTLYVAPGIHFDTEVPDPANPASVVAFLGSLLGSSEPIHVNPEQPTRTDEVYVDMPTARLKIGGPGATSYDVEYALVVDLGGVNSYRMNAGGLVGEVLFRSESDALTGPDAQGVYHPVLGLFPVSLLLDAGTAGSTYQARRGLVQGAGFFSVGVAVDLGGNDSFVALPTPVDSRGLDWMPSPPVIDGTITQSEWPRATIREVDYDLPDTNDSRFLSRFTVQMSNDARKLYLAIQGTTRSGVPDSPEDADMLVIDLDPGRAMRAYDDARGRTGIDKAVVLLARPSCAANDLHATSGLAFELDVTGDHVKVGCNYETDGRFTIELSMPLRASYPVDEGDVDLGYDDETGYLLRELGFHLEFREGGTGARFVWPAGTTDVDGDLGYAENGALGDEMAEWTALGVANLETDGLAPSATRAPSLSQGAAVSGVGILAMLGEIGSGSTLTASDRSQGYAAYSGLGMVIDAGGSDRYVATTLSKGAADEGGVGIFLDADGNDNYVSTGTSLGATSDAGGAVALFVDLHGYDEYLGPDGADAREGASDIGVARNTATALGQLETWRFNDGRGVDYLTRDSVRGTLWQLPAKTLWGNSRLDLTILKATPTSCLVTPVPPTNIGGERSYPVVSDNVCLQARVRLQGDVSEITLDSVDFLVDGRRVATVVPKDPASADITLQTSPLNSTAFPDGVRTFTAVAALRLEREGRGAVIFYDQRLGAEDTANADNDGATVRTLVNNPTFTEICTGPKLNLEPRFASDECKSNQPGFFSPFATAPSSAVPDVITRDLRVSWGVPHDAIEDRLQLGTGWNAPAFDRNFPCEGDAGALCNYVPLYMYRSDSAWSTTPPEENGYQPFDPRNIFRQSTDGNPYFHDTPTLTTPLQLYADDAFHVFLANHQTIIGGDFTTRMIVTARNDETLESTVLADESFNATPQALNLTFVPGAETLRSTFEGLNASVLESTVGIVHDLCQSETLSLARYPTCIQFYGNPGVGLTEGTGENVILRPCYEAPPQAIENIPAADDIWRNGIPRHLVPGCQQAPLMGIMNDTARTGDREIDGIVGDRVRSTGSTAARPFNATPSDNWHNFWFDIDTSRLGGEEGIEVSEDGKVVTLPAGYSFKFEMYLTSDNVVSEVGEALNLQPAYSDLVGSPVNQTFANARGPFAEAICDVPVPGVCQLGTATYDNNVWLTFRNLNFSVGNLLALDLPLPLATFTLTGGSRLDLRVPSEPSTLASVTIERIVTGETVRTLVPPTLVEGDLKGTPTRDGGVVTTTNSSSGVLEDHIEWGVTATGLRFTQRVEAFDGLDDSGSLLPDGSYRAWVTAHDVTNAKEHTRNQTFIIDSTPPSATLATRGYAGAAALQSTRGIPLAWSIDESSQGSGVKRTWLWMHAGGANLEGHPSWTTPPGGAFPASVRSYVAGIFDSSKNDYYFILVAEDNAGNVEYQSRVEELMALDASGSPILEALQRPATSPQERAFLAKLYDGVSGVAGTITRIIVDPGRPVLVAPPVVSGAEVLYYQGVDTQFVRAGAPFRMMVCVRDPENGIGSVQFAFDYVNATTGAVTSHLFESAEAGGCGANGAAYEYTGWGNVNTNKTLFPDGAWSVSAEVEDLAGNRIQVPVAAVILDSRAPNVRLLDPVYPPGQAAVKPGDRVSLRIFAEDAYGVNESGIRIDARRLSSDGILRTRPVRIDGVVYQEATFKVDNASLVNGVIDVPLVVPDNANNVFAGVFRVAVDFRTFTIPGSSATVSNVTHNSVTLKWRTTEPTTSMVRYGTAPLELKGKTPVNTTLVYNHTLRVDGLQPSTRYFLRAVSTTAGGFDNESETLEAITTTALYIEPVAPGPGAALSGPAEVRFRGGVRDAFDFVTYTLDAQSAPDQPWTFVTTLTEQGDMHALVFNSTRYLDGDKYRLRVTAEAGKDVASIVLGPFLSDNTAPELSVFGPLVATSDTTPDVTAEARDNLAYFGVGAAQLLIDDQAVEGLGVEASGQALRIVYSVPSALSPGVHAFELRVRDRAGNLAVESWRVAIDGEAPLATAQPIRYSPGPTAAKLGGTVTLNVTLVDTSGIASAVADTRGVGVADVTRLDRVKGTDHFVGTFTVAARDDNAIKRVLVNVTDLAGNSRLAGFEVQIDNTKPIVGEARVADVTPIRASLTLDASEPVLLVASATAPASPPASGSTTVLTSHPTLVLEGLLPSRSYAYSLQALDRAGNAADLSGRFQTEADLVPPQGVKEFTVLDLLTGTLRLSWSEAQDDIGIAFYRVYRADDGVNLRPIAEVRGLSYDDAALPLEKPYLYQVVAVDHGGNEGPGSERIRASATAVPRLSAGVATPTVGSTATVFRYQVVYTSPGGVAPSYVRVLIDGAAHEMTAGADGLYAYETRLAPHKRDAPHTYAFEASDGRYTAKFPADGSVLRGPLVSGDALAGEAGGVGFAQRIPLVGILGTATALTLAAAVVVLIRRRGSP